MGRKARKYAFCLLFVFALGGVVAPVAHYAAHALGVSEHSDEFAGEVHFEAETHDLVDCYLCQTVISATTESFDSELTAPPSDAQAVSANNHFYARLFAFDSRAPPVLA